VIIARYLSKEVTHTMVAVTVILLFVFMGNMFVRYLNYVAGGKYAAWVLVHIVLLQVPILLGLLLPLGVYLGILIGYGRLYNDSEMTVLAVSGLSYQRLAIITFKFSLIVMVFVAILSLWLQPIVNLRSKEVLAEAKSGSILQTIIPGRFQIINNGKKVYYIEKVSNDRSKMKNVFMAEKVKPDAGSKSKQLIWAVMSANGAHQSVDKKTGDNYLVSTNGNFYKGRAGGHRYQIINFDQYGVLLTAAPLSSFAMDTDTTPTSRLIPASFVSPRAAAELQWRLSIPLSVVILALLALPLSQLKPRQGKFARILPAILLYIVYVNLLFLAREWIQSGKLPAWLGMWWIHFLFLLLAIVLILRKAQWTPLQKFRKKSNSL
jgi:lipopolysaccharide export system permease protein